MKKYSSFLLLAAILFAGCVRDAVAQIPDNGAYPDVDVFMLNKKVKEIADKGLINKWALSKDSGVLTVEMTEQWTLLTPPMKAELTRRILSVFAFYVTNRDARQWNFSVILEMSGVRLAEDRGTWWQNGKNPEVFK